jgi:hypothetical protein
MSTGVPETPTSPIPEPTTSSPTATPTPDKQPPTPAPIEQSRMHRFQVGDRVAILHGDISPEDDSPAPTANTEGDIVAFDNDERTYLRVAFDSSQYPEDYADPKWTGGELVVTEDEVRRVG